jgi:outer membrane cobalamin receptor
VVTGSFNLSTLLSDALDRVEVVRGTQASRYGSQALGGVIRLSTREARQTGGFFRLEGGSYGTLSESLGGSLVGDMGRVSLTLHRDDIFQGVSEADPANGNTERDNFHSTQGVLRVSAEPSSRLALNGSLLYTRARVDLDVPGVLPSGQPGNVDDATAVGWGESWLAQGTAALAISPAWQSRLQLGFVHDDRPVDTQGQRVGAFTNRLLLARWTNDQRLYESSRASASRGDDANQRVSLRWGAEVRQEEGENLFDLPGQPLHGSRTVYAGIGELRADAGPWGGVFGGRVEHYDDFGTHPTFYGGMSWQAAPAWKLRASGGYGYRPPSFHERFFIPLYGNPALQPEQGWSGDVGLDWTPSKQARLSVTGFYSRIDDLIQLSFSPSDFNLFVSENVSDARLQGVEIEGDYAWNEMLSVGADYTYTDAEDLDNGRTLPRRPAHQGRVFGEWRVSALPLTLYVEAVYRGSHFDDRANTLKLGDAVYLNAQASYRISPHLLFYVRGENLSDDRTPEFFSFGARGAAVFGGVRADL